MELGSRFEEGTQLINSSITRLQMLNEIDSAYGSIQGDGKDILISSYVQSMKIARSPVEARDLLRERINDLGSRYDLLDPFISVCSRLITMKDDARLCVLHFYAVANAARKFNKFMDAMCALQCAKQINWSEDVPKSWLYEIVLEESKLLWRIGGTRKDAAMGLARKLLNSMPQISEQSYLNIEVLSLVGKWSGQTCKEHSKDILNNYLLKAVDMAKDKDCHLQYRTQFRLACYADSIHDKITQRLSTTEYIRRQQHVEREHLFYVESEDVSTKRRKLMTQDVKKVSDSLESQCKEMALIAIKAYHSCLLLGSRNDLRSTMRLCSLWLSDANSERINEEIKSCISNVASHKFVSLVYQLISRISSEDTSFQSNLKTLITRLVNDHPHHTLCQIYSLKSLSSDPQDPQSLKSLEASKIWESFRVKRPELVQGVETLIGHYVAINSVLRSKDKTLKRDPKLIFSDNTRLPRDVLRDLQPLPRVHLFTIPLEIDQSCEYPDIVGFETFDHNFVWMDGVNSTKMITTIGSDGKIYKQIGKYQGRGDDDLRQDAIMQQLFGLVNTFFGLRRESLRRNLRMRTYKVVPFSRLSGILECVESCRPFGSFAEDAHIKYRPSDWTPKQCRAKMAHVYEHNQQLRHAGRTKKGDARRRENDNNARKSMSSAKQEFMKPLATFKSVCKHFQPAFHNFFLEKFPRPSEWYERRLAFTRSVAASSMITYLVGLGDRHSSNILVDSSSAEVIHIDHGIAFEQGKWLDIPETVPFRLTRDMIDGMGITGTEGVMRQCCEDTMKVLRENKNELMTIMEVLLYDPLHSWTLTQQKAAARQKGEDVEVSLIQPTPQLATNGNQEHVPEVTNSFETFEASTVLHRIREKLDGVEMGEVLDVKSQVQRLIQEATDPERLSSLYYGWAPWL